MSVVTETTARLAEKIRVTRSRRNVAWTGAGALIVVDPSTNRTSGALLVEDEER